MGKCKFNPDWLIKKDPLGYKVSEWARKKTDEQIWCIVCETTFSCTNGWAAIDQHVRGCKSKIAVTRHAKLSKEKLNPCQLRLAAVRQDTGTPSTSSNPANADQPLTTKTLEFFSPRDQATKAELIWVLKCIQSNYSFNSCGNIADTFSAMFPALPDHFSLGATKATYLLTDALAPYFKSLLIRDVADGFYSIGFDETTNDTGLKELQVAIRYWSNSLQRVTTQHLQTFFIGHARANDIVCKLNDALNNANLTIRKLIMLSRDGPNVNKAVQKKMNEQVKAERGTPLLDLESCNIHTAHNAFSAGLRILGYDASDFIVRTHDIFDDWPSRWEDFQRVRQELKLPSLKLIKHVPSRWLTLEPAALRVVQLMPALKKYFLECLPKAEEKKPVASRLTESKNYRAIRTYLKSPTAMAELHFVISSAKMFTRFTGFFQKDEPLIHLLYSQLQELVNVMLNRICKTEAIDEFGLDEKVLEQENLLPVEDILDRCDEQVVCALKEVKDKDRLLFANGMLKHYETACRHVKGKTALGTSPLSKYFRCLRPDRRKSKRSISDIKDIAKILPLDVDTSVLLDEWLMLQTEDDPSDDGCGRIDVYWNHFFGLKSVSGDPKYPTVTAVVKCALSCAHGNPDLERGFSDSGRTLTPDRASMSERTLDATQTVKSTLKLFGNQAHLVPMTRELLGMARGAYAAYEARREEEKKRKENQEREQEEERQRQLKAKKLAKETESKEAAIKRDSATLANLTKTEKEKQDLASKLFNEAQARLAKATASKNMMEVMLAQGMMTGVEKLRLEGQAVTKDVDRLQRSIDKRKTELIETMSKRQKLT